jgi:hypothetical protein
MLKIASAILAGLVGLQSTGASSPTFTGPFTGWSVQGSSDNNFTMRDSVLHVQAPNGWLRSDRQYGDFTLRTEFRFLTDDADSGIYVRAVAATPFIRGWPNQSYQVQVRNPKGQSRFPPVGGLFRHGMPDGELVFDEAKASSLSKPTGEWQTLEIDAIGERLTVRLNGTEVMRAGNIANARGYIGVQGEVGALEFRTLEIRER